MQSRAHWLSLALITTAAVSGCASDMGGRVDGGTQALSPEERRLQALENKLVQMQRRLDALNTTRFDDDNQRLKDDMRGLRGDVEKSRFDTQQQDARNKNMYLDLDRRLQRLESAASSAPAAPAYSAPAYTAPAAPAVNVAPAVSAPAPAISAAPAQSSAEEEGAYLATFDLLKAGKYDDAIKGFRSMLDKWPSGRYADNAAYWMGEANYVKRDYDAALAAFQTVLQKYPTSAKVPDTMLKIGLTYNELKRSDDARSMFQLLVKKYPSSNAAKLAQQRLSSP